MILRCHAERKNGGSCKNPIGLSACGNCWRHCAHFPQHPCPRIDPACRP